MTNFEKNLAKVQRKHPIRKWWNNNGYKVQRVVLFPVWAVIWSKDKIQEKRYDALEWSEERATAILDRTLPDLLEDYDGALWYSPKWRVWFHQRKGIHGTNKEFARKYNLRIQGFLADGYQIEGYTKTIEKDNYETWIKFGKRG